MFYHLQLEETFLSSEKRTYKGKDVHITYGHILGTDGQSDLFMPKK